MRRAGASRARLPRHPPRARGGARDPAAARDRPRHGRPADLQRGPERRGRPQRRDLQLPRASPAPSAQRAHPHDQGRHRGDRPPLRGDGNRMRARAARHVRLRALGRTAAAAADRPRPRRQEAPVLRAARGGDQLRLGAAGAAPGPRGPARDRLRGARQLPRLRLRAGADVRLPGRAQAASGLDARLRGRRGLDRALLAAPPRPSGMRPATRPSCTRRSGRGSGPRSRSG